LAQSFLDLRGVQFHSALPSVLVAKKPQIIKLCKPAAWSSKRKQRPFDTAPGPFDGR